jgi:hypothetical protein
MIYFGGGSWSVYFFFLTKQSMKTNDGDYYANS